MVAANAKIEIPKISLEEAYALFNRPVHDKYSIEDAIKRVRSAVRCASQLVAASESVVAIGKNEFGREIDPATARLNLCNFKKRLEREERYLEELLQEKDRLVAQSWKASDFKVGGRVEGRLGSATILQITSTYLRVCYDISIWYPKDFNLEGNRALFYHSVRSILETEVRP